MEGWVTAGLLLTLKIVLLLSSNGKFTIYDPVQSGKLQIFKNK